MKRIDHTKGYNKLHLNNPTKIEDGLEVSSST